ncbi:hypothetical protein [Paraburkholderia sp. Ac-20347]|uniref:hypothetical protein n=1 Tax=Paraburkholderia sp. Ac-20347 TaxID=2703892 RepID=UPI00197E3F16|nr:hypothetical protein [Paraburkholderia sp. Ac-20347]MBN3812733.1 hypothetical protein [Paraburkholderia sp. Ac-20347]
MSKRNNKNKSNRATPEPRAPLASEPARKSKLPKLMLIGVGSAIAAGVIMHRCSDDDDQAVDVERVRYDSLAACLADWNQPSDCGFVCDAPAAADARATVASGASVTQAVAGGAASDGTIDSGVVPASSECTQAGTGTQASSGGHGGGGHSGFIHAGHWYGPYYTRAGTVYHANGMQTHDAPSGPLHGTMSSLYVRSSSLGSGSDVFRRSPDSVSVSEGRALTRGGFTSSRAGGHSSAHGGGGHGSSGG